VTVLPGYGDSALGGNGDAGAAGGSDCAQPIQTIACGQECNLIVPLIRLVSVERAGPSSHRPAARTHALRAAEIPANRTVRTHLTRLSLTAAFASAHCADASRHP